VKSVAKNTQKFTIFYKNAQNNRNPHQKIPRNCVYLRSSAVESEKTKPIRIAFCVMRIAKPILQNKANLRL